MSDLLHAIKNELTLSHLIAGTIFFAIVHANIFISRKLGKWIYKKERRAAHYLHHIHGHARPLHRCDTGKCAIL